MRTKMKIMGLRGSTIKPLNEDAAAELGAELLGEAIVFLIGGGCVILEYTRQSINSRRKEEELNTTIINLQTEIAELKLTTETHDAQLREFNRLLQSFSALPKKWYRILIREMPCFSFCVFKQERMNIALYLVKVECKRAQSYQCSVTFGALISSWFEHYVWRGIAGYCMLQCSDNCI